MGIFNNGFDKKDKVGFSKEGKVLFVIFILTTVIFTFIFLALRLKGYQF